MENEIELEHSLMKAPHEGMNKVFRSSQKALEKELNHVVSAVSELQALKESVTCEAAVESLEVLVNKLVGLKRKIEESKKEEEGHIQRFKARMEYLKTYYKKEDAEYLSRWNASRVDRVVVDYMLREGLYDSAVRLASDSNVTDLVDIEVFISSKKVIEGLTRCDCTEALQWCADNRSKLKKIKSNLEFSLRIQEFIELVRSNKLPLAITYARKHLSPCASTNMKEIQQAMATLAFLKHTKCEKYKTMFDPHHWSELIEQFKHDNYVLFSLTSSSLLDITVQAGISAIKTPMCGETEYRSINCPACNPNFSKIAHDLPCALHSHSRLVCRITGEIMNEDNPPMVLPNGFVYSKKAVYEITARNGGKMICPQTNAVFRLDELKKAFIS